MSQKRKRKVPSSPPIRTVRNRGKNDGCCSISFLKNLLYVFNFILLVCIFIRTFVLLCYCIRTLNFTICFQIELLIELCLILICLCDVLCKEILVWKDTIALTMHFLLLAKCLLKLFLFICETIKMVCVKVRPIGCKIKLSLMLFL